MRKNKEGEREGTGGWGREPEGFLQILRGMASTPWDEDERANMLIKRVNSDKHAINVDDVREE